MAKDNLEPKQEQQSAPKAAPQPREKVSTGKEGFNKTRIIIGIVIMVVAIAAVALAVIMLSNRGVTYNVLQTRTVVEKGVMITKENVGTYFQSFKTTDASIAGQYISADDASIEKLFGKYVKSSMNGGEFVSKDHLSDIIVYRAGIEEKGRQLVGFHIPSIEADIGYMPQAGDIIRFYGLEGNGSFVAVINGRLVTTAGREAVGYELLRNVEIFSVLDSDGKRTSSPGSKLPTNMVLNLSEAQTKQLIEAQANGGLYMALVSTGNAEEKARLLKEQQQTEDRLALLQTMIDVPEREPVTVPYSVFESFSEEYVPVAGDTVAVAYLYSVERKEVQMDGTIKTKTVTELTSPELLACVRVRGMYRDDDLSADLALDGETAEERAEHIKNGYVSLELAPEQVEALTELMSSEQVYLNPITAEGEELNALYLEADAAIRRIRVDKALAEQDAKDAADADAEKAAEGGAEEKPAEAA